MIILKNLENFKNEIITKVITNPDEEQQDIEEVEQLIFETKSGNIYALHFDPKYLKFNEYCHFDRIILGKSENLLNCKIKEIVTEQSTKGLGKNTSKDDIENMFKMVLRFLISTTKGAFYIELISESKEPTEHDLIKFEKL